MYIPQLHFCENLYLKTAGKSQKVHGREKLPERCQYVCWRVQHTSFMDVLSYYQDVPTHQPQKLKTPTNSNSLHGKKELFEGKFKKLVPLKCKCIPCDRANPGPVQLKNSITFY